jgi:quercetin dioxygenase-like cupin family protein
MLIERGSLRLSATTSLFEGGPHGVGVSIFFVDYAPGTGTRLHVHPHPEVFVIEAGEATFTVDNEEIKASAGQILIAPANKPHRFWSTGSVAFRSINVVPSGKMAFTWLEDEPTHSRP